MNIHKYLYKVIKSFLLMSQSTRYFQLTPDILVEYNYSGYDDASNQTNTSEKVYDLRDGALIVDNNFCSTKTFLFDSSSSDAVVSQKERFVLPINNSESKFIQAQNNMGKLIWNERGDYFASEDLSTEVNQNNSDILKDSFRLHFTSRNYLGDYDGFIITLNIYDKIKNKIGLLSQYVKKTDDPNINENPMVVGQKLYTTYIDFELPSIWGIVRYDALANVLPGEKNFRRSLSPKYDIMDNTPLVFSIYGIKSQYVNNNFEYYNTEKINTIYIPIEDKSNSVNIQVKEADDGDYFKIYPMVNSGEVSFSDYLYNLSDGRPEIYIVFHELSLIEHFTKEGDVNPESKVTHREQYIINVAQQLDYDEELDLNEDALDTPMYFRPVLLSGSRVLSFTISVKTTILNTLDNTSIVKTGSHTFGEKYVKKYGKRMNRIYLGEVPAQVNVYNRKPDLDIDGVKITNASSSVKIENHQHSVIGFIECANVGVAIEQIPKEYISTTTEATGGSRGGGSRSGS